MNALHLYPFALGSIALLSIFVALMLRRNRKTPEQRERERRERINTYGRITDGNVLDVQEPGANDGQMQLIIYQYDVAGVTYEASQDITTLRQYIDLHSCRLGLPASIKYDPHNPGDSIVVAEGWTGLRQINPGTQGLTMQSAPSR
ncbi:MAG: hypothetical protein JO187_00860 [Acidobacteria bacterium]|nr:hypothetical protein [Acidobacteriota bacterium]